MLLIIYLLNYLFGLYSTRPVFVGFIYLFKSISIIRNEVFNFNCRKILPNGLSKAILFADDLLIKSSVKCKIWQVGLMSRSGWFINPSPLVINIQGFETHIHIERQKFSACFGIGFQWYWLELTKAQTALRALLLHRVRLFTTCRPCRHTATIEYFIR